MARLTPQFSSGLVAHDRPVQGLLVQAGLIGMTVPVTVAATGGIAGILLWFRHPSGGAAAGHPGRVRLVLALLFLKQPVAAMQVAGLQVEGDAAALQALIDALDPVPAGFSIATP